MVVPYNKILINFNAHTHTIYCDGKGSFREYADFAIKNSISLIGFSSHAPINFENNFSININLIQKYVDEIRFLNQFYGEQIELFVGLECDYIPDFSFPFDKFRNEYNLDYIIGGIHLVENTDSKELWFIDGSMQKNYDIGLENVFNNDIRKGVTQYFMQMMEMIETQNFEVLAHLDKIKMHNAGRFFSEDDYWYKNLCLGVVDLLKNKDIIVEINTRGIYKKRCPDFYPSRFILENLLKNKTRITLSSDAHQPQELNLLLDDAAIYAKSIGFKDVWKPAQNGLWESVQI
ncbi:MAG: histidinol-phosphatase [Bacteroidota bacterium]